MKRSSRRLTFLIVGLIAFLVLASWLYQLGMVHLEGKPRTFLQALEWAGETLSTTGYGADSGWKHPVMVVFVVAVQFVGVFLVFLIIPIAFIPFLEERFEEKVPREAPARLTGHVIVYGFAPTVETLLQRLAAHDVPTLVLETNEMRARELMERQQAVVFVRSDEDALEVSRLGSARALVANAEDQENAALILRARQMGFTGDIFAFVENPTRRKPMELAGATAVYTPRHIVAAGLAAHASDRISPRLPGLEQIEGFQRRELRVGTNCAMAGKTLRAARLPAAVVGIWSRSQLVTRCTPDTVLEAGAVLELAGTEESLQESAARIGAPLFHHRGVFVIAGFGEVGRKVHELLTDVGEEVRVLERYSGPKVDVIGDVLDTSLLEQAGVANARALILALDSDDSTLFATVIVRDLAPNVPIIARVNHARNLANIHRAGADYALSIADISGQMLTARLLGGSARAREEHRRVECVDGAQYAGRTPHEMAAEGKTVLALERNGAWIHRVDPEDRIGAGDRVWICAV